VLFLGEHNDVVVGFQKGYEDSLLAGKIHLIGEIYLPVLEYPSKS
jgi:hypothetical protein